VSIQPAEALPVEPTLSIQPAEALPVDRTSKTTPAAQPATKPEMNLQNRSWQDMHVKTTAPTTCACKMPKVLPDALVALLQIGIRNP
jgi:hypothetical protein